MYQNKYNSVEQLKALWGLQKIKVQNIPFNPDEWNCTYEEMIAGDKELGEDFAARWIAFSKKLPSKEKQLFELYWVCDYACAFPASSLYSLPILITEIERLESKNAQ